ncbi:uncharacterized protein LOC113208360 isoform X2 [Frankliniella occidentalis]|nr:uncharacterized protein LOC113208360 isoform X2 [Frankliniella occidentalis]
MEENKHKFKWKYSDRDLKKESKIRVDAILGAQDEIPDVLMNFVTVDSDFEEVSDETIKKLGLFSIMLTPTMINCLDEKMTPRFGEEDEKSDLEDDFVDVEDSDGTDETYNARKRKLKSTLHSSWHKKYKNSRGAKSFKRHSLLKSNQVNKKTGEKIPPKTKSSSLHAGLTIDLTENGDEQEYKDKDRHFSHKWGGRLASGSFPCKLCFRKFRSKGEAQSHMALHKPNRGNKRAMQPLPEDDFHESEDSSSMKFGEDEWSAKHCSMERQRRAEMASFFQELQDAADVPRGSSKLTTLSTAKSRVDELEMQSEEQDREIAFLQEKNARLKARYLELNPDKK